MNLHTRKLVFSGILMALTVSMSGFSIPVGAAKCFPVQHFINVISGIFLGPFYSVSVAFGTSIIRNLMGTGSLLAFPGSMTGAFLAGWLYRYSGRFAAACAGELLGTGILGALLCYPVAALLMGNETAVFAYMIPFMMSSVTGTIMAAVMVGACYRSGIFLYLNQMIAGEGA